MRRKAGPVRDHRVSARVTHNEGLLSLSLSLSLTLSSLLSRFFLRNESTQSLKHFSTSLLYIRKLYSQRNGVLDLVSKQRSDVGRRLRFLLDSKKLYRRQTPAQRAHASPLDASTPTTPPPRPPSFLPVLHLHIIDHADHFLLVLFGEALQVRGVHVGDCVPSTRFPILTPTLPRSRAEVPLVSRARTVSSLSPTELVAAESSFTGFGTDFPGSRPNTLHKMTYFSPTGPFFHIFTQKVLSFHLQTKYDYMWII